ncbi:hypothetical protein CAPTEDRAFT_199502 [Capitella teleta]|uniref:Uncharacterized protein n=1 Tax=Capitella teleta TaxID=283909 RepID=R7V6P4_CAPTE|nr:hypothetical protein CAPTEDRAFT_199502 [Capitella teleta]|eukprot:ELU14548.1 hypothetical protein CAPTEDRAFT_199502 [Capitella teleta]
MADCNPMLTVGVKLKFGALNDSESSEDEEEDFGEEDDEPRKTTKEAQETKAVTLYNEALVQLKEGLAEKAKKTLNELLTIGIVKEAEPKEEGSDGVSHPALVLKYSCYKNLASLAVKDGDLDVAVEYLLQAVNVDATDVTVWHKIGVIALKLEHFSLARHSFEQGLECNSDHWPCMDQVITLLYALNNYHACLVYISRALSRDPGYLKGLVFMHKIFKEQKSFKYETLDLFRTCDQSIYAVDLEEDEIEEFLPEALEIRRKRTASYEMPPPPVITLPRALNALTWKSLGEVLLATYDYVSTEANSRKDVTFTTPRVTFGCKVDLSNALETQPTPVSEASTVLPASSSSPATTPVSSLPSTTVTEVVTPPVSEAPAEEKVEEPMEVEVETAKDQTPPSKPAPGKRGPKRKRLLMDDDPFGVKRRSTRVRNTIKKKEETVNYQDLLRKFLPHNLLECDDEMDEDSLPLEPLDLTTPACRVRNAWESLPEAADIPQLASTEEDEIKRYINEHQNNSGILDLLNEFLIHLARYKDQQWPKGLPDVYLQCYNRFRSHIEYPNFLSKDQTSDRLRDMAEMGLTWAELHLDYWMTHSLKTTSPHHPLQPSPRKSPSGQAVNHSYDFLGQYFPKDLHYLVTLSEWSDILGEKTREFSVRVFWLRARFYILQNKTELAVESLNKVSDILREDDSEKKPFIVLLVNCSVENLISAEEVQKQEESLKRCQSLEEVQRLHEKGSYAVVVETLLQTFTQGSMQRRGKDSNTPERHAQLLLLQDSLLKLTDYRRCLLWGEVSINEALQKFLSAPSSEEKDDWICTMVSLFQGIDKCISEDHNIINNIPSRHLVRLVHNLIRIIEFSMDVPDGASDMAISTLQPWILLYRLIEHEEDKVRKLQLDQSSDEIDLDSCLPSAILLLNVAHEYLGRRCWCTHTDGFLLHFIVEVLTKELLKTNSMDDSQDAHPFKEHLHTMIEQCFFCLYGHPNKKAKTKHLQDHNSQQITLTWERSVPLFDFFKPSTMPDFDSYRTSTVSGELENLLRRISSLVPAPDESDLTVESIQAYIDDSIQEPPAISEEKQTKLFVALLMPIVKEVYYLLADYYFKNKEQA